MRLSVAILAAGVACFGNAAISLVRTSPRDQDHERVTGAESSFRLLMVCSQIPRKSTRAARSLSGSGLQFYKARLAEKPAQRSQRIGETSPSSAAEHPSLSGTRGDKPFAGQRAEAARALTAVMSALQLTVRFGGRFRLEIRSASCWNICAMRIGERLRRWKMGIL